MVSRLEASARSMCMTNMKYRIRFTARDNEAMFSSPKFAARTSSTAQTVMVQTSKTTNLCLFVAFLVTYYGIVLVIR